MKSINKNNKNNKSLNSNDNNIILTDDKMITDILGNIGKKSKNPIKKTLIDNFINEKTDIKKSNQKITANNDDNNDNKKTYTSNLTKDEINEKLQDYKLVDDINKVALGTHLRYFTIKDGIKLFRMGGNLKRNLDLPKFVVLVNALGTEWTVQVKDTIFYKKMTLSEIKNEYDEIIKELHEKIIKCKNKINEKDKIIIELQETIKKMKSK